MGIDYFSVTINAVFTGLGVAVGNEIWALLKARREKLKHFIKRETKTNG